MLEGSCPFTLLNEKEYDKLLKNHSILDPQKEYKEYSFLYHSYQHKLKDKSAEKIFNLVLAKAENSTIGKINPNGETILHSAVTNADLTLAYTLIDKMLPKDLGKQDISNKATVLHYAVINSDLELAYTLIKKMLPKDLGKQDIFKATVLHYAVIDRNEKLTRILINKMLPRDVSLNDQLHKTAYNIASERNYDNIVEIIRSKSTQIVPSDLSVPEINFQEDANHSVVYAGIIVSFFIFSVFIIMFITGNNFFNFIKCRVFDALHAIVLSLLILTVISVICVIYLPEKHNNLNTRSRTDNVNQQFGNQNLDTDRSLVRLSI